MIKSNALEKLRDIIEQWHILKKAPLVYWSLLSLCVAATFIIQEYRYSGLRESVSSLKESVSVLKDRIDKKEDELKIANRQLEQRKFEIDFFEKAMNRYKNIALGIIERNTFYAQMTNEELKTRAVNIANKIREITRTSSVKLDEIEVKYRQATISASNEEKKKELSDKYDVAYINLMANFHREYNKNCKSDAINICNEIISRLPSEAIADREKELGYDILFYESPTNFTGAEAVATHLERLAITLTK